MHVELLIDKTKQLPVGSVQALKEEFQKRLDDSYPSATFAVRRAHSYGLSVVSGTARDKEVIDVMLQNMWESLEDWLQPGS